MPNVNRELNPVKGVSDTPSGSLQHAGRRADALLKKLKRAILAQDHTRVFKLVQEGVQETRRSCAVIGVELNDVLAKQRLSRTRLVALVKVPRWLEKKFEHAVESKEKGSSRNAASTGRTRILRLLRHILTLQAAGIMTLLTLPEESPPPSPRVRTRPASRPVTTEAGDTLAILQPVMEPALPAYGSLALMPGWRERLEEAPSSRRKRHVTQFLDLLSQAPTWEPLGPDGFSIPGWYWAPSLEQVRGLYDKVLGPVWRDPTVRETIIPAIFFSFDHRSEINRLWPELVELLHAGSVEAWRALATGERSKVFFPAALWKTDEDGGHLPDWLPAVAAINRKARPVAPETVTPTFSHGIVRGIEVAVLCGRHVLVLGAAGTGKSTLLSVLAFPKTAVFEIGDGLDNTLRGFDSYRREQFDQRLRKAERATARRVLLVHELVLSPAQLCKLGCFHQIIIVGDPRQPGPAPSVDHIIHFMQAIGAASFTLQLVWRCRNVNPYRFAAFIGYGGALKPFKPWHLRMAGQRYDFSVSVLPCAASPGMRAATMLAHAVMKVQHGRSVLIATDDVTVMAVLEGLLNQLPDVPNGLGRVDGLSEVVE